MTTVGIFFGCFIPFHSGHHKLLCMAKKNNDEVLLGVCGFKGDRGEGYIPFCDRVLLMKEICGQDKDITISTIDDKKIGLTGAFNIESWKKWCAELFADTKYDPMDKTVLYRWYTGEPSYKEKIEKIYPHHEVILVNRHDMPISGTKIRQDLDAYIKDIHPVYIQYLKNNLNLRRKNHEI